MLHACSALRLPLTLVPPAVEPKPPSTLLGIFADCAEERLEAGSTLFWQGDDAIHVFEIVEGAVRIVRILGDGRRAITGFLFAGDLIGVGAPERYLNSAEAIVPIRIRRSNRRRFTDQVSSSFALHHQLFAQLSREIAAIRSQVVLLACKTAEERVSSFLLAMARRTKAKGPPAGVVHLPMTRLDIADYLGLTIETVSRAMTRLRMQGIVAQIGRHTVAVRRPDCLAMLAADDDRDRDKTAVCCSN
jgi:CRP/FNR family transcriptional regulator